MNLAAYLSELRQRDIRLWVDGERLRCNAPAGVLTPELRAQLSSLKQEIVEFFRSAQGLAAQQRAIVPLQQIGRNIPVFAVPGHNGDVFCYRALSQALGDDQPFFGLQPPGLDGHGKPLRSVEGLAGYFAAQIRASRLGGPCIIAGFCSGGTVAFELAQQLLREGAAISFVALFGSQYPSFFGFAGQLRSGLAQRAAGVAEHLRAFVDPSWAERGVYVARILRQRKSRRAAEESAAHDPVLALRAEVEDATRAAVRRYRPTRFPGRLCLFLPSEAWARSGAGARRWRSLAPHVEEYIGPEGCNGDNMLRAPNALAFAELFRVCRDKDQTRRPIPKVA